MSRKNYVEIAEILNSYAGEMRKDVMEDIVNDFIVMFEKDNDNFNSDLFWEECFKNTNHN